MTNAEAMERLELEIKFKLDRAADQREKAAQKRGFSKGQKATFGLQASENEKDAEALRMALAAMKLMPNREN